MEVHILRQWRKAHGHSQQRLADAIDVHPTAISKFENRENYADLRTFYRLIRYTGIDAMAMLQDIFERDVSRPVDNVMNFHSARRKRQRAKRIDA